MQKSGNLHTDGNISCVHIVFPKVPTLWGTVCPLKTLEITANRIRGDNIPFSNSNLKIRTTV